MAAYFIAQYKVNNPDLYREYQAGAGPTIAAHGAELVAFDVAAETIDRIIVVVNDGVILQSERGLIPLPV